MALTPIRQNARVSYPYFPAAWQAVIFRNWDMIPAEKLAQVVKTDTATVLAAATDMGLPSQSVDPIWLRKGYITIIRQNWHLLNYDQLLMLLDWDAEKLSFTLKEDDFLEHKLGGFKPDNGGAYYFPPTGEQQARTAQIRGIMKDLPLGASSAFGFLDNFGAVARVDRGEKPGNAAEVREGWGVRCPGAEAFAGDFIRDYRALTGVELGSDGSRIEAKITPDAAKAAESHVIEAREDAISIEAVDAVGVLRALTWLLEEAKRHCGPYCAKGRHVFDTVVRDRIIYSYCAVYGDCTERDLLESYPDGLLKEYSRLGINGVWMQGILYKLSLFPFDPSMSEGYEQRRRGIRSLIERAARYGIRIYLYLNEPRAMDGAFFEKYPALRGAQSGGLYAMCTSTGEVRDYLYDAVRDLTRALPGLGGYFTITASENLTNCYAKSHDAHGCPRCGSRKNTEVIAQVNTLIAEAAWSIDENVRMIAWDWAWKGRGPVEEILDAMPAGVGVMCTSEEAVSAAIGGVDTSVVDYSIGLVGPGDKARSIWRSTRESGHPTYAKVQFNNTWENSAVPYIPTFGLVLDHLKGVLAEGVNNLFLSWTLGGYPSVTLELVRESYFTGGRSKSQTLRGIFGNKAELVERTSRIFGRAFREFPFHIGTLYVAPQNYGPAAPFFAENTGFRATMIGFPYDDLEGWRSIYPPDIYTGQMKKLSDGWEKGLGLLDGGGNAAYEEYRAVAEACLIHFRSCYNLAFYTAHRDDLAYKDALLEILDIEEANCKRMLEIIGKHPAIGYEASNHYYYDRFTISEKIINCRYVKGLLE